jgi:hypothetical protein
MWIKLRPFALVLSLVVLALPVGVFLMAPGPRIVALVHPIDVYREDANRKAYAARLRADADRLNRETDYTNALARLTEAAEWDSGGDRSPQVEQMRATLRTKIDVMTTAPKEPWHGRDPAMTPKPSDVPPEGAF